MAYYRRRRQDVLHDLQSRGVKGEGKNNAGPAEIVTDQLKITLTGPADQLLEK